MNEGIEIYIRNSSERAMLTLHIPAEHRAEIIKRLAKDGAIEFNLPTHLEFSVLPEWIQDPEVRDRVESLDSFIHCRLPISSMHIH